MKASFIIFSFIISIYIGCGAYFMADLHKEISLGTFDERGLKKNAVKYQGVEFRDVQQVLELKRREQLGSLFPWIFYIPIQLGIVITVFFAGVLGGIFKILKNITLDGKRISEIQVYGTLLMSGMLGFMILGISYLSNVAIVASNNSAPRPLVISLIAFLGGGFSELTYKWLEKKWKEFLKGGR